MFYPYSSWLKQRYGEKVYKLPVNLPVSCPNRCDGHGGCTFCSEKGTGFESVWQPASVTEQMQHLHLKQMLRLLKAIQQMLQRHSLQVMFGL